MRKFKKNVCVLHMIFVILFLNCLPIQASESADAQSQAEEREIAVGYIAYDRLIKQDKDGNFYGYGVSYLNELSKKTGWTYKFVKVNESDQIYKLINGEIDLLCSLHIDVARSDELYFSSDTSVLEYTMLCAKKDNDQIFYNNYEAIDGKRIGINTNSGMESSMQVLAQEHGITYKPVYFSEFEDMHSALEEGTIDIMLASSLRDIENIKYVGKGTPIKEYFATGSSNKELMDELNGADAQIKQEYPFYTSELYEQYYGAPYRRLTGITKEENEFIQRGKKLRVACNTDNYPLEYFNEKTDTFDGVYVDAMQLIAEESGLKFEFIPVGQDTDAWVMTAVQKADLVAASYGNSSVEESYDIVFSQAYLSSEYTIVGNKGREIPEIPTIVLDRDDIGVRGYFKEMEPTWKILLSDDVEGCLESVENGDADFTAVNAVFLQTVYNLNNYSSLKIIPNLTKGIPVSIGIGGSEATVIKSILDKAIYQIPDSKFQKCITENAINIFYEPSLYEILKRIFPYVAILLLAVAAGVMVVIGKREKHYRYLAMTDSITGLWNGVKFNKEAVELLEKEKNKTYLLLSMDINKFKFINNDFGSKAGDKILEEIGDRIRRIFKGKGYYARIMADVFLVLTEEDSFSQDMLSPLQQEIYFDNNGKRQYYKIAVKIGICSIKLSDDRKEINVFSDQAALARKTIKDNSNKNIAYYNIEMKDKIAREIYIENRMEEALLKGEFKVYLQPKYDLRSGIITGAEALVRWEQPDNGLIMPDVFIGLFEKNGFIIKLDFFVYEEVMKQMKKWKGIGKRQICVSVNVSRVHIGTVDFFQKLEQLIDYYQIDTKYFELELTENIMGGEKDTTRLFVQECKNGGYQVSIDDFGSGYSSLNLLKDLPVDIIKIDKGFLDETEESKRSSIIVEQVVEMAKRMEIGTICEGVETEVQAEFLKGIGCDMAQGYLYSRPVTIREFEKMI